MLRNRNTELEDSHIDSSGAEEEEKVEEPPVVVEPPKYKPLPGLKYTKPP